MGVWQVSWYMPVLVEANKLWLYAIAASMAQTCHKLSSRLTAGSKLQGANQIPETAKKTGAQASITQSEVTSATLLRQLIADGCDLTLPMSFNGWIRFGELEVGIAMLVSSVLIWPELWLQFQA